jgi:hypothetical protein
LGRVLHLSLQDYPCRGSALRPVLPGNRKIGCFRKWRLFEENDLFFFIFVPIPAKQLPQIWQNNRQAAIISHPCALF